MAEDREDYSWTDDRDPGPYCHACRDRGCRQCRGRVSVRDRWVLWRVSRRGKRARKGWAW